MDCEGLNAVGLEIVEVVHTGSNCMHFDVAVCLIQFITVIQITSTSKNKRVNRLDPAVHGMGAPQGTALHNLTT